MRSRQDCNPDSRALGSARNQSLSDSRRDCAGVAGRAAARLAKSRVRRSKVQGPIIGPPWYRFAAETTMFPHDSLRQHPALLAHGITRMSMRYARCEFRIALPSRSRTCLLYTSDAADDLL